MTQAARAAASRVPVAPVYDASSEGCKLWRKHRGLNPRHRKPRNCLPPPGNARHVLVRSGAGARGLLPLQREGAQVGE